MNKDKLRKTLTELLKEYPDFITPNHLVEMGLYPSVDSVYLARKRNETPYFIQFKRKLLYPKPSVLEFLLENAYSNQQEKDERRRNNP